MKTSIPTGTSFSQVLNSAETNNNTGNSMVFIAKQIKATVLAFVISVFMMSLTCSCSMNSASGCGAWPMANTKTYKNFKAEAKPVINKNSKQYSSYKRYN